MKNEGVYLRLVSDRGRAKNASEGSGEFYEEPSFNEMVNREKKRSRRSRRPLMLMRLDVTGLMESNPAGVKCKLVQALASGIRETDVLGWHKRGTEAGIVFTELKSAGPAVRDVLVRRVMAGLVRQIDPDVLLKIKVSCQTYPEDEANRLSCGPFELDCHKDLAKRTTPRNLSSRVKFLKDVVGHFLMT